MDSQPGAGMEGENAGRMDACVLAPECAELEQGRASDTSLDATFSRHLMLIIS